MTYRIELGPADSPNLTLEASDIADVNPVRPHTAVGDFDATIPYDRSIRDRMLDRCRIYADDILVFRGYLHEADWDQNRGSTRISGPGIGVDLDSDPIEVSFSGVATADAIDQVWTNHTDFDATVTDPSVSIIISGQTVASPSTTSDWQTVVDATPTAPATTGTDRVEQAQSAFILTREFGAGSGSELSANATGEVQNSYGEAKVQYFGGQFGSAGDSFGAYFTLDYDLPANHGDFYFRYFGFDNNGDGEYDDFPAINCMINGENQINFADRWGTQTITADGEADYITAGAITSDLPAGDHTITFEQENDSDDSYDELGIGIFGVVDDRYSYNFDNTVKNSGDGTSGTINYLDGPELYPDVSTVRGQQVLADANVVDISLTSSGWSNLADGQAVGVSADGGSTWTETIGGTSVSADYPDNIGRTIDWRLKLSRRGSGREQTPANGYLPGYVSSATVEYDGSDLPIIRDQTFRGPPLKVLRQLHRRSDMRFVIDHAATDANGNLAKTAESFPRGEVQKSKNWSVQNRKPKLSFVDYRNRVTIYGALQSDGTRPKVTVQDDDEVSQFGAIPFSDFDTEATTLNQVRQSALDTLRSKVAQRTLKGSLSVLPTNIQPGYSYPVDWFADGQTSQTPLEKVSWSEGVDQMRGTLEFVQPTDITGTVIDQGFAIQSTKESI